MNDHSQRDFWGNSEDLNKLYWNRWLVFGGKKQKKPEAVYK